MATADATDRPEEDERYPPFDEEQFQEDYYRAQRMKGGGYGSPRDF